MRRTIEGHADFAGQLDTLSRALTGRNLEREFGFPMIVVVVLVLAVVIGLILHGSVCGRYWYAIGRNEQAARYAGINTNRQRVWSYMLCSLLASLGGILTFLEDGSVTPESTGETWELYAITGAVLGGCTLRGGEGTVPGMLLGAAVLPLLRNLINRAGNIPAIRSVIPAIDPVIPIIIGLTLLAGEHYRRRDLAQTNGRDKRSAVSAGLSLRRDDDFPAGLKMAVRNISAFRITSQVCHCLTDARHWLERCGVALGVRQAVPRPAAANSRTSYRKRTAATMKSTLSPAVEALQL